MTYSKSILNGDNEANASADGVRVGGVPTAGGGRGPPAQEMKKMTSLLMWMIVERNVLYKFVLWLHDRILRNTYVKVVFCCHQGLCRDGSRN